MLKSASMPRQIVDSFKVIQGFALHSHVSSFYLRPGSIFTVYETICPKHKKCRCVENGKFKPEVVVEGRHLRKQADQPPQKLPAGPGSLVQRLLPGRNPALI